MSNRTPSFWARYGVAILSIAAATGLRLLLNPVFGEAYPFATIFLAVVFSAWYGGFGPALTASVCGAFAAVLFLVPARVAAGSASPILGILFYWVMSLGIASLGGLMALARQRVVLQSAETARQREQLRATLSSIGDAVAVTDELGRLTSLNAVAEALTGWKQAEAAGRPLEEVFRIINEETGNDVESPVQRVLSEGVVVGLANHTILLARDGARRPIDDSAAPIRDDQGRLTGVVLVFRDITNRREQERRRTVRLAVAQIMAHAANLREAAPQVLQALGEGLVWTVGALWIVDHRQNVIRCQDVWQRPDALVNDLVRVTKESVFPPGDNLLGRVWAQRQPLWVADVSVDEQIVRRQEATASGMRSSLVLPIYGEQEVLGLIEFFSEQIRQPDADLLEMMTTLGGQFGQFLDRQRATEQLTTSEAELAEFFENATIGLHWVGPDGIIQRVNQAELQLLGYSREEYVGRPITNFHADQSVIEDILSRLTRGETLSNFEAQMRCKDGSLRDVLIDSSVLWKDGQFVHTRCFTRDVTERRRAEHTARFLADASDALAGLVDLKTTLENVARLAVPFFADWCLVDLVDADNRLHRMTMAHVDPVRLEAAQEIYARWPSGPAAAEGPARVLQTGCSHLVPEITAAMLAGSIQDPELLAVTRDLGIRSYIGVPLAVKGKALGVLTFLSAESGRRYNAHDLAAAEDLAHRAAVAIENSQLYHALRESDRRKDEFLAVLAHELRNPLAPIASTLAIMKLPTTSAADAAMARAVAERQLAHLTRLVDDLLDVSRIMRGKIELRMEPVELSSVIEQAVESVQPAILAEGHELLVQLPPEPIWLEADPVRMSQVISNLLSNAAKYTEPQGRITVEAQRAAENVMIRVSDTGIGIAPEAMPRLFEMFMQVAPGASRSQGGLGIGLTLVKKLVEMHGGTVAAHSDGPGQGSAFAVTVPARAEAPAAKPMLAPAPPAPHAGRRILVVDDNIDAAKSLAILLRLHGHDVRTVYGGAEAIQAVAAEKPELVLLDIGMPGMNGYEVARELRQQHQPDALTLIALTGWGQEQDRRRSQEAGFDHHLTKPVELATLQAVIQTNGDVSAG